jgi:hypothetical protein
VLHALAKTLAEALVADVTRAKPDQREILRQQAVATKIAQAGMRRRRVRSPVPPKITRTCLGIAEMDCGSAWLSEHSCNVRAYQQTKSKVSVSEDFLNFPVDQAVRSGFAIETSFIFHQINPRGFGQ